MHAHGCWATDAEQVGVACFAQWLQGTSSVPRAVAEAYTYYDASDARPAQATAVLLH